MALTQPRQSKEEDLTAVLGRFKAWNTGLDAQREPECKTSTVLEEISYEEALVDLGKRRILARPAATRQVDLSSAIKASRDTLALSAASQLQSMQAKTNSAPGSSSFIAERFSENIQASPVAGMLAASADAVYAAPGTRPRTEGIASKSSPLPAQKKAAVVRAAPANPKKRIDTALAAPAKGISEKRAPQSRATTASKNFSSAVNAQLASSSRPQPTFKAVLEERLVSDRKLGKATPAAKASARTSAVPSMKSSMVPWVESQAVSLKLRISAGEHATIKAGASEAGLPLAAYMRQCTLDVEVLRKLLKQTIADIRTFDSSAGLPLLAAPARATVAARPSRPGLLERLKNAWLDRATEIVS